MKILRFLTLALLALALVLAGCSSEKQEGNPPPSPTPTPTPPPANAHNNKDCKDNQNNCELDTQQIEDEAAMKGHDCATFDPSTAIGVMTKGNPDPTKGNYKGVKIKAKDTGETFDVDIVPCDSTSPAKPFANAPATGQTDWTSGALDPGVKAGMKYQMKVKRNKKGGKGTPKKLDPHIVFCG